MNQEGGLLRQELEPTNYEKEKDAMIKNALTSTNVTRETLSRREFLAGSAAVGATIMTGAPPSPP